MPMRPSSASLGTSSLGNLSALSHSRAYGAISRLAKSRTVRRRMASASLSSKSIMVGSLLLPRGLRLGRRRLVAAATLEALLGPARGVHLDRLELVGHLDRVDGAGGDAQSVAGGDVEALLADGRGGAPGDEV